MALISPSIPFLFHLTGKLTFYIKGEKRMCLFARHAMQVVHMQTPEARCVTEREKNVFDVFNVFRI